MPIDHNLTGPWNVTVGKQDTPDGPIYGLIAQDQMTGDRIVLPFSREGLENHVKSCQEVMSGVALPSNAEKSALHLP